MFGLALAAPVTVALVAAVVVASVLFLRRTPAADLPVPVADARRRSALVAVVAVVLALALVGLGATADSFAVRNGQLLAVLPLAAAALHTVVVLVGELSWPRPRTRVRSARLVSRSMGASVPRGWLRGATVTVALTVLTCAAGIALAAPDGRSLSWTSPDGVFGGTAGPFPGTFYAGPVLLALATLTVLVVLALHRLSLRPAVADPAADAALRRTTAHRVLRVATAATLATTGALLFFGGIAAHGLGGTYGIDGVTHHSGPGPLWDTGAAVLAVLGALLVPVALAVLLVPARRVGPPAPQRVRRTA